MHTIVLLSKIKIKLKRNFHNGVANRVSKKTFPQAVKSYARSKYCVLCPGIIILMLPGLVASSHQICSPILKTFLKCKNKRSFRRRQLSRQTNNAFIVVKFVLFLDVLANYQCSRWYDWSWILRNRQINILLPGDSIKPTTGPGNINYEVLWLLLSCTNTVLVDYVFLFLLTAYDVRVSYVIFDSSMSLAKSWIFFCFIV